MRFLGSLTIFLASAQAAATVDDLITTFNAFKDAATELQGDARQVNADSCASFDNNKGPLNVLIILQVCVNTFYAAVKQATEFAETLGGSPDYCGARADELMGAYTGFTDAHQRLFHILSHKGGEVAEVRKRTYPTAGDAVVSSLSDVKDITTVRRPPIFFAGGGSRLAPIFGESQISRKNFEYTPANYKSKVTWLTNMVLFWGPVGHG
ncbi:hypothetical protein PGQ11_011652 [Apiospora arundinis]|uniref:Fungal N-terminal domain-containing protein n=1 Tax=Apiospora arundinis TaxID=335852 RepID=A0ABR2I186_9PEZI